MRGIRTSSVPEWETSNFGAGSGEVSADHKALTGLREAIDDEVEDQEDYEETMHDTGLRPPSPTGKPQDFVRHRV